jgi:hypothetical protein
MTKDEALDLALEALGWTDEWRPQGLKEAAITAIKQARSAQPAPNCTRSHPHENMDAMCELRTEIARLTNKNARLKAQPAPVQEPVAVDQATMELAESVGLIGPSSRTHDLHAAIQRFHDLICVNATIKAAKMAADAICESTPPAAQRQWVGLTDEEIERMGLSNYTKVVRETEAKLKEKNT